jgi:superfamily I DNA/RNA helicase
VNDLIREAAKAVGDHKFGQRFLLTEWDQVVDAWQLADWEAYRDVARLGRKTRLPAAQRKVLWSIFERVRDGLKSRDLITYAELFTSLAATLSESGKVVFDFAVVDEAQDVSVAHIRFLAALGGGRRDSLFFAGDLGQRIFQQPFSWKSLGVHVRGRSRTLRVNYRTSHQIRIQADRLLGALVTDVDGNADERSDTISMFNGPPPTIQTFKSENEEITAVGRWIAERAKDGLLPHEFGVFVRSGKQLNRAQAAVVAAGVAFKTLDDNVDISSGYFRSAPCTWQRGWNFAPWP